MSGIVCAPDSPLQQILGDLEAASRCHSTVLLLGESGTGKELCARRVHERSQRSHGPFVALNCAALPLSLLESELFGHEKGAFTGAHALRGGRFEAAQGGTLFLDEIGELPLAAQAALLRVLQERSVVRVGGLEEIPVDVRLVAATHRDLWAMVLAGTFRQDLFFRLHVLPVHIPALRHRRMDIPCLARALVKRIAQRCALEEPALFPAQLAELSRHDWPGNIRELENFLERWMVLGAVRERLDPLLEEARARSRFRDPDPQELARQEMQRILDRHGGHRARAAAELGITRRALNYRLVRAGICTSEARPGPG
jgi:transcriptional regulator with PAS, ATPase and Fis domain